MGRVFYCTREEVQDAFDVREAAHRSAQIDRAIASASDDIDGWLNRHKHGIAPTTATRYFDWPSRNYSASTRIWFDENELVTVTALTSGGAVMAPADYFLEPINSGPPFTYVEINTNSSSTFSNLGTHQHAVSITGVWGLNDDRRPAGTLTEALDASETAVDVSDGSLVGVGSLVYVDSERMLVTGRSSLATGQVLGGALDALKNDQSISVVDGTQLHVGELLLVDSERMRIVDIQGNTVTVLRAYDGSTLAAHLIAAPINAFRTLNVERGALGSTAATHLTAAPVTTWDVPSLVRSLCVGEAITRLEQEFSAYGARVYSDEAERDSSGTEVVSGRGLTALRKSCARRYKRKFRKRAV